MRRSPLERLRLALLLLSEYEAEEKREEEWERAGGLTAARERITAFAAKLDHPWQMEGARRWAEAAERHATSYPEPPRDSGEADAVNGPTALRTHQDNTRTRAPADPGARP